MGMHDPTVGLEYEINRVLDFDNVSALDSDFGLVSASEVQSMTGALNHDQLDTTDNVILPSPNVDGEDYTDFPRFIPNFVKPDKPCDYCASRGLDCHMYFGKITCKACDSLFRPCSFAHVSNAVSDHASRPKSGTIDTLHIVQEDACVEKGGLTGTKLLRCNGAPAGVLFDESKKANNRFPRTAVIILRQWFELHANYPYPTEAEKARLEEETGLKANQIATWLANTRRRSKAGSTKRAQSPSVTTRSQPVDMSTASQARAWTDLTPYERWQHSPPENDPAPIHAIADAIAASDLPRPTRRCSANNSGTQGSSSGASLSAKRAHSITSTGRESSHSNTRSISSSVPQSQGSQSSLGSFNSFGSGALGKRDRQRKRKVRATATKKADDSKRIFQCTFCCDTFKTKYDWTRHEKSLHLSLEKWVCAPLGPAVTDPETGIKTCVYCQMENPSGAHFESHGHNDCVNKGIENRTFYRKDHLRQHLRLMHRCELTPRMNSWMASADFVNCRCGFCAERFTSWELRNAHLASHFKAGAKMSQWKRCRGLDPEVAAMVTNAMPPYLIGFESGTPNPFSASKANTEFTLYSTAQLAPGDCEGFPLEDTRRQVTLRATDKATCWEILAVRLGHFVKEQSDLGIAVTDEALQSQSRHILYGNDDPLDHTAADNPEWLELFKKAHGMDIIPTEIGGVGKNVPEDLELYVDLGMRIPFHMQQKHAAQQAEADAIRHVQCASRGDSSSQDLFSLEAREARDAKGFTTYDLMPISSDRAAHFANEPKNNPRIAPSTPSCASAALNTGTMTTGTSVPSPISTSNDAVSAIGQVHSYSPGLSLEQQAAWDQGVAKEAEQMKLFGEQNAIGTMDMMDLGLGAGMIQDPQIKSQDLLYPDLDTNPAAAFDPMEFLNVDMMLDGGEELKIFPDTHNPSETRPFGVGPIDMDDVEFDFGDVSFS